MLARSGLLPTRGDWAYEVKWDGFRAIVSTEGRFRDLNGTHWQTPETFDDGELLFQAVCEHELEGVVAKRKGSRYRPGERGWVKMKNHDYWRYEIERESAINKKRVRQF